jgi:hypothetical protein
VVNDREAKMPTVPAPAKITKPKMSGLQRRAIGGALEDAQEWLAANTPALTAQAHSLVDRGLAPLPVLLHRLVDQGLAWGTARFAALKL